MTATLLFVASNPTTLTLDFAGELTAVQHAWRSHSASPADAPVTVLARWSVGVDSLRAEIARTQPDIVHLLSPGVDPATHALVMADAQGQPDYATTGALAAAFDAGPAPAPRLVVINTCHSAAHAEAVAAHVGCAIGIDDIVYDHVAIAFTSALYECLSEGRSVADAFSQASQTLARVTPKHHDSPRLFAGRLDPSAITFVEAAPRPRGLTRAVAEPIVTQGLTKMFCSYSHKDEKYRRELETHLSLLTRRGVVDVWHDRRLQPGQDWAQEIDHNLDHADIILLLVSADFLSSQYCFGKEMTRALERATEGQARLVPILVRKCDLEGAPFGHLQWLPTGSKPVKNWSDRDSAWTDVAKGVRQIIAQMEGGAAVN